MRFNLVIINFRSFQTWTERKSDMWPLNQWTFHLKWRVWPTKVNKFKSKWLKIIIILAVQKDCVEHFAGRLVEYLVLNVTAWDKASIMQLAKTLLKFMSPSNGNRYEEFFHHYQSAWKFEGPGNLFTKPIYAVWQKFASLRDIARGIILI